MLSPFQSSALKLRAMGYSVLPLMPQSKRPAIEGWSNFGIKEADDETFNRWMIWKDSNIGVCLGVASNLICIDLDHNKDGLHEKIKSMLPVSPVGKVGYIGESWFYQFNGQKSSGYSKDGQRVLDVLSQGRQTVLPPSIHPTTGQPYKWITEKTLFDIPAAGLPHISLQTIYDISKIFVPEPIQTSQPRHVEVYADTQLEEIADALTYISCEDYDVWIRIAMGLRDKFGEKAFSVWDNWSSTSQKYKAHEMRGKWNSFKGQGITVSSLFYLAMDNGYSNMSTDYLLEAVIGDFELNGRKTGTSPLVHKPKTEMVPAAALPKEDPPKKTESLVFPSRLLSAPGLIGQILNFVNRTALMPQPILALGSAIAASGAIMGRKVRGDTNLRTNFYIIGLAPSGSGKDHARTVVKRMLHDSGLGHLELGVPASSAGLISGLRERGRGQGLILWDEFGRILKQISNFRSGTHEKDIVTALIELFSSSQSIYMGKQYANHDGKNPIKPIDQPCLSVYATSVPSHFYDALSGSEAIDGFLSRWMIFESKDYTMEEEDRDEVFSEIPQAMVDLCKYWKEQPFNSEEGKGNLADTMRVVPRLIKCSDAAGAQLKNFATEMRKLAMTSELAGDNTGAIWSRAGEHARRLALAGVEGDQIEVNVADWAISLSRHCCNYMAAAINDYVSSSELESQTKRVLKFIKDKSSKGVWATRAEITRSFQGVQSRTRMEILGSLVERGEINEEKVSAVSGRPTFRYKAV